MSYVSSFASFCLEAGIFDYDESVYDIYVNNIAITIVWSSKKEF